MTGCHLLSRVLQLTLATSPIAQGSAGTMWASHSQGDFYVPSPWVRFDCPALLLVHTEPFICHGWYNGWGDPSSVLNKAALFS